MKHGMHKGMKKKPKKKNTSKKRTTKKKTPMIGRYGY